MRNNTKIAIGAIAVVVLLMGSMGFYFFFIHNWEPLYPLNISDKNLMEKGATDDGMEEVVWAHNQFAVDLYQELVRNNTDNLIFSPFSIYLTLCMIYEGVGGETKEEMKNVLHLMNDDEERRGSFAKVQNDLNNRRGRVDMKVANNLWTQDGLDIEEDYEKIVKERYFADIDDVDFQSDPSGAIKEINDWVEEQTNGKIKDILQPGSIDPLTVLAFVNALYFSGEWETAFDEEDTNERSFHTLDNRTVMVPSMYIDPDDLKDDVYFRGYNDNGIQAHELPYKGREISMVLMMPSDDEMYYETLPPDNIFKMERDMSADVLEDINEGFYDSDMSIMLPKFDFDSRFYLKDKLTDLGMGTAFTTGADMSGIVKNETIWLEEGVHQANIKVDEKGTEAAAATVLWETCGASMPFQADRPFMFLIQDRDTGLILFMGRVMDPSK
jgi:serine protease inhibitor